MTSAFESAERWEVSLDTLLPKGNHVATIVDVEGMTSKSMAANPQIVLKVENSQGSIRDWLTYNEKMLGKVSSLFDAAEVKQPQEGEYDEADKCRLTDACIRRLLNKKVGVIVREEPDDRPDHMGEVRLRVKGYRPPRDITGSSNGGSTSGGTSAPADDSDIPFNHDEFQSEFDLFHGTERT